MKSYTLFSHINLKKVAVNLLIMSLPTLATANVVTDDSHDPFLVTGATGIQVEGYNTLFDVTFRRGGFIELFADNDFTNNTPSLDAFSYEEANKFSQALASHVITGNLLGNPRLIRGCESSNYFCDIVTPFDFDEYLDGPYSGAHNITRTVSYSLLRNVQAYGNTGTGHSYVSGEINHINYDKNIDYPTAGLTWADWTPSKTSVSVPEIDAATLPLSIGLLLGFIAFIREKRLTTLSVNS